MSARARRTARQSAPIRLASGDVQLDQTLAQGPAAMTGSVSLQLPLKDAKILGLN
jgi:hypothetical protein